MTQPLSESDIKLIKSKIDSGYFSLAKVYGPFLLALILANQYVMWKSLVSVECIQPK
jgi:hypothetical protein